MDQAALTLNGYQIEAVRTDRTKHVGNGFDLPILGLFGETGSLLSEVKKKQRDSRSYLGYEQSVIEEMGDVLWYLAVIADHAGLSLASIAGLAQTGGQGAIQESSDFGFLALQPQQTLPLNAPTVAFERTLLELAGAVGRLAEGGTQALGSAAERGNVAGKLAVVFKVLLAAANEASVTLDQAASANLKKAGDRWPKNRSFLTIFDCDFPVEEQMPRSLTVDIFEREAKNGRHTLFNAVMESISVIV